MRSGMALDTSLPPPRAARKGGAALLTWGVTLLFNVVLPFVTYALLTGHGMKTVPALTVISVWPLVELGLFYRWHHRFDEVGILTLILFGLGIISALSFNSARLVVVKDSAITGLLGVAFIAS